MNNYPELLGWVAELDMGLWGCAVIVALWLVFAMAAIVIEQAWRALRYCFKWRKGNVR
ncbi:hypothetical protein [Stenotrophomonas indicatrix]|uniref:hypothetical protein n=1 Tax=Stenotrophomonas indicatrix TaxID=2045451 RepID=UPI00342C9C54